MIIFATFAPMNHNRYLYWLIACLLLSLTMLPSAMALTSQKIKYPGGKFFIWRYTLKDKQGSTYTIEHPGRWLSRKAIERRIPAFTCMDTARVFLKVVKLKQAGTKLEYKELA